MCGGHLKKAEPEMQQADGGRGKSTNGGRGGRGGGGRGRGVGRGGGDVRKNTGEREVVVEGFTAGNIASNNIINNNISNNNNNSNNTTNSAGKESSYKGKGGNKNVGVSSSSVDEEMRIRFTSQLHQLRESEVTEVQFPSTLNNVERKFLHKLAQELGLKSKSKGKGDDRFITVTKGSGGMKERKYLYKLKPPTLTTLEYIFQSFPRLSSQNSSRNVNSYTNLFTPSGPVSTQFYEMKQLARVRNSEYHSLQRNRAKLPAFTHNELVVHLIKNNDIVLISGETGCGKTTQVPQFILDDPEIGPTCRIAVTQPRRLSAMSVSERIATERGEQVGDMVGYNIRLESEYNANTRIHFMTPGVLLRILQNDPELTEWTHIIIDEAHERDRYTEFLFIILRDLIQNAEKSSRKPKLILMSATMHIEKLSNYFGDIPHVHIGSSRFSVEEFYLEHILRFTGFRSQKKESVDSNKSNETKKTFTCPICKSSRKIFYSAIELGTHVAMCNGIDNSPIHETIMSAVNETKSVKETSTIQYELDDMEDNFEVKEQEVIDDFQDELLVTEDPSIISDVIGESSFTQAASRFVLSHTDDEIITQYQKVWDDSMVDIELIHSLLKYIFRSEFSKDHGVVLVFLPGWDDISRLKSLLLTSELFRDSTKFRVLALHSGISKQDQREVFLPVPHNVFKIVLSTNIAETSVTIDNVTVVIDSGRSKEKSYDPHVKLSSLKENWISQSSANQRKGRAGRTRTGVCFRLYSSRRYHALPTHQDSELTRTSLEELVLTTKLMGLVPEKGQIYHFLSKAMDPPHPLTVTNAINSLISLKCLTSDENITTLGKVLSQLPMDPFLSRALVLSALFGVLGSMIRLACAISYRDPFVIPGNDHQRALSKKMKAILSKGIPSDQMTIFSAMTEYERLLRQNSTSYQLQQFLDRYFLSRSTMHFLLELEKQLHRSLESTTGISIKQSFTIRYERNERKSIPLLISLIGIGLYSTVAVSNGGSNFTTEKGCKARVHPSSVNRKHGGGAGGAGGGSQSQQKKTLEMIAYQELVAAPQSTVPGAASLLMISTCPVSLYTYLLSCGSIEVLPQEVSSDEEDDDHDGGGDDVEETQHILVDGWLRLTITTSTLELISLSRRSLQDALTYFLDNPRENLPADHLSRLSGITDAIVYESPIGDDDESQNHNNHMEKNRSRNDEIQNERKNTSQRTHGEMKRNFKK